MTEDDTEDDGVNGGSVGSWGGCGIYNAVCIAECGGWWTEG